MPSWSSQRRVDYSNIVKRKAMLTLWQMHDRLALAENAHYHHLRGQVLEFLYQKQVKKAA